jgi:hypothetical protein
VQAQELVAMLRAKKVLQFCTAAGKAAYSTAVEMVGALCMDKRPQLPQAGCAGSFVQELNKSLAYFVREQVEWQQTNPRTPPHRVTVIGMANHMCFEPWRGECLCSSRHACESHGRCPCSSRGTITLEDLPTFHIYQNFVPKIIMNSVNQWTSELVSATAMVAMVSDHKAASSSHGPGPAKKGKTSHRSDAESQESASQVFSLFA